MAPFSEETFGPVAPITVLDTYEEAGEIANDTPGGVHTGPGTCLQPLRGTGCGYGGHQRGPINSKLTPFGGVKESGLGREGSYNGMDEYCEVKYVCFGLGKDAK